ncbi:MAG: hypothetical protein ACOC2E_00615, partial [Bacteroidota bacterium]
NTSRLKVFLIFKSEIGWKSIPIRKNLFSGALFWFFRYDLHRIFIGIIQWGIVDAVYHQY